MSYEFGLRRTDRRRYAPLRLGRQNRHNLDYIFHDDPRVFVAGDLLWYAVEGNLYSHRPDASLHSAAKGHRGSTNSGRKETSHQVVFEVLPLSTDFTRHFANFSSTNAIKSRNSTSTSRTPDTLKAGDASAISWKKFRDGGIRQSSGSGGDSSAVKVTTILRLSVPMAIRSRITPRLSNK